MESTQRENLGKNFTALTQTSSPSVPVSMHQFDPAKLHTLGADLRALRKSRGLTLSNLADQLGRSVGWLSQVERDMSDPSISDLRQIADAMDVPVSFLFGHASAPVEEQGYVVRAGARRPMGSSEEGLIEELLSPDLTDEFEVIHSTFQPGASLSAPNQRPTQEVGYVLSGKLDLTIAEHNFTVGPGDSFRLRGEVYDWGNPYEEAAVVIWVIAPPVY